MDRVPNRAGDDTLTVALLTGAPFTPRTVPRTVPVCTPCAKAVDAASEARIRHTARIWSFRIIVPPSGSRVTEAANATRSRALPLPRRRERPTGCQHLLARGARPGPVYGPRAVSQSSAGGLTVGDDAQAYLESPPNREKLARESASTRTTLRSILRASTTYR